MSTSSSTARPPPLRPQGLSRLVAGLGAAALTAAVGVATTSAASASSSGSAAPHQLKARTVPRRRPPAAT